MSQESLSSLSFPLPSSNVNFLIFLSYFQAVRRFIVDLLSFPLQIWLCLSLEARQHTLIFSLPPLLPFLLPLLCSTYMYCEMCSLIQVTRG